jgi:hypothetical protein
MYVLDTDKHHLPHIHVRYNAFKAVVGIPEGEVLEGNLPSRQMKLIEAWVELRRDDLMADWILASSGHREIGDSNSSNRGQTTFVRRGERYHGRISPRVAPTLASADTIQSTFSGPRGYT